MKDIKEIALKYQVSEATVTGLLEGFKRTGGSQIQFNSPELGGMGQWQPGMIMIGDMFNNSLKDKVYQLCTDVAALAASLPAETAAQIVAKTGPESHRHAAFRGSQNNYHYAYYASENVLEIEENGKRTKYSTKGYSLTGVQQAQSNSVQSLSFTYPGGTVSLKDLKEIKDK